MIQVPFDALRFWALWAVVWLLVLVFSSILHAEPVWIRICGLGQAVGFLGLVVESFVREDKH